MSSEPGRGKASPTRGAERTAERTVERTTQRTASCSCGQLRVVTTGEPARVSLCHCLACQKRTGSVFGAQARFAEADVTVVGESRPYARVAESGHTLTFSFCPHCGATVHYVNDALPGFVGIPLGAFAGSADVADAADAALPAPAFSVYERSMHAWVTPPSGARRSRD